MNESTDLERAVTDLLADLGASASLPDDAWERIITEISDGPNALVTGHVNDIKILNVDETLAGDQRLTGRRRSRLTLIAAAAVAVISVGLVMTLAGDSAEENIFSAEVQQPQPPEPDPTPSPEEAGPAPSVVDSLGYRWSRLPHDEAVFGVDSANFDPAMTQVIAGGPGLVAVGTDGSHYESEGHLGEFGDAAVWTSVDGVIWSRVPHDEAVFGGALMNHVTVRGPDLVAVGQTESGAVVWTSVDGLTWSRVPLAEEMFRGVEINSVTAGGPGLVAVGSFAEEAEDSLSEAAVWTSVDGLTWSRVPLAEEMFRRVEINSVTAGGPGLVAVGSFAEDDESSLSEAAVWTSVDGLTWSRVPHDEAMFGADAEQRMDGVIVGGPGLVAVGWFGADPEGVMDQGAAVWTSVDGLTWSRVAFDRAVWGYGTVTSLVSVDSGVVAVGADYAPWLSDRGGRVWTSPDGITWSRAPHETFFNKSTMASVTVGAPGLVAVGDTFNSVSDAVVWVAMPAN